MNFSGYFVRRLSMHIGVSMSISVDIRTIVE